MWLQLNGGQLQELPCSQTCRRSLQEPSQHGAANPVQPSTLPSASGLLAGIQLLRRHSRFSRTNLAFSFNVACQSANSGGFTSTNMTSPVSSRRVPNRPSALCQREQDEGWAEQLNTPPPPPCTKRWSSDSAALSLNHRPKGTLRVI